MTTRSRTLTLVAVAAIATVALLPLAGMDVATAGGSVAQAILDAYAERLYATAAFVASCL